jgi:hypothetical protein
MTVTMTWRGEDWAKAALPALNDGLTAAAAVCANQAVVNLSQNKPPSQPGDFPGHDQSNLRNSIAYASPDALGTPLKSAFGTAVFYGRVLEFGKVITPRNKQYLKVPLDRALARHVVRNNLEDKLVLIRPKDGGPALLCLPVHKGEPLKPVYKLVKSVQIKPRPWIVRSAMMARDAAQRRFIAVAKQRLKAAALVEGN